MRTRAAIVLLALLAPPAYAGDVETKSPDGTVLSRYSVDEQGRRHGAGAEFWPNGEPRIKSWYRAGLLEGAYQEFHADGRERIHAYYKAGALHGNYTESDAQGRPTLVTAYAAGKIHGKLEVLADGRRLSLQEWRDGVALSVDGVVPHPRELGAMRATVASILDAAPAETDRERGLRRLKAYRYLCEVPWEDCALRDDLNELADAAARICERLGGITHTPRNPGLPEEEFKFAARGCANSNLYGGGGAASAADSVDGYMDDSDPGNIDRVGHRRWCLNPPLQFTGFGVAGGYSAMWSMDRSRAKVPDYEVVAYPPRGWCFPELTRPDFAWSLSLHPGKFAKPGAAARVAVYPVDAIFRKAPQPVPLDYFKVTDSGAGIPYCLIFRPKGIDTSPGKRYWVEVTGVERLRGPPGVRYLVEFAAL